MLDARRANKNEHAAQKGTAVNTLYGCNHAEQLFRGYTILSDACQEMCGSVASEYRALQKVSSDIVRLPAENCI